MTEIQEKRPEITIAFLNYNTPCELIKALESVPAAAEGVCTHITVIDNNSTDDSVDRLREYDSELDTLILDNNIGFAAGFNRIFSHVVTPYYLLLNSDIILPPGCIKKMIGQMKQNPDAGIAGMALVREDGSAQTSYSTFPSLASELINRSLWQKINSKDYGLQSTISVDCVIGAALLIPRKTVEEVGEMDEQYFFFFEETDWCRRIKNAGLNVLHFSDIKVTHLQGKAANTRPVKARIEFHRSRLIYFKKYHGVISAFILRFVSAIRLIINFTAMLILTICTLGISEKYRNKMMLYAGVLAWYLRGCQENAGLKEK